MKNVTIKYYLKVDIDKIEDDIQLKEITLKKIYSQIIALGAMSPSSMVDGVPYHEYIVNTVNELLCEYEELIIEVNHLYVVKDLLKYSPEDLEIEDE